MFPKPVFAPVGRVTGPVILQEMPKNDVFLFDLDALTTNDHGHLDHAFATYLLDFAKLCPCYLFSRANYNEVMLRVPSRVRYAFAGIFSDSGSELWVRNEVLIRHEHDFSDDLYEFVAKVIQKSSYPNKLGPMIDCGSACLRICLAGTRSSVKQIADYLEWEIEHQELPIIMDEFRARFSNYAVYRDTASSLLIMPISFTSAMVQNHIIKRHKSARVVCYLTPRSADGFARPLYNSFSNADIVSQVGGPSDVSQLLSYENRCLAGQEHPIALQHPQFEEV
jgi:hypothetical protein